MARVARQAPIGTDDNKKTLIPSGSKGRPNPRHPRLIFNGIRVGLNCIKTDNNRIHFLASFCKQKKRTTIRPANFCVCFRRKYKKCWASICKPETGRHTTCRILYKNCALQGEILSGQGTRQPTFFFKPGGGVFCAGVLNLLIFLGTLGLL